MNKRSFFFLILSFLFFYSEGQSGDSSVSRKKYVTQLSTGVITLDGIPSEDAWNSVEWGGDFIQRQPNEGAKPSQETAFKILYDERFLYVAVRCYAKVPD